jgi:hypothetical protein
MLARVSGALDVDDDAERTEIHERLMNPANMVHAHHNVGVDLALEFARNSVQCMIVLCGPEGYKAWQRPEGPSSGLFIGETVIVHNPMPLSGSGEIHHSLDGVFAAGTNLFFRHRSELYGEDGTHYQTIVIVGFVREVACEGLPKMEKSTREMPAREADFTYLHQPPDYDTIDFWSWASGDPNNHHSDPTDPRAHGTRAISIIVQDVLRQVDHDVSRLRYVHCPGLASAFFQKDAVLVSIWDKGVDDDNTRLFLCRFERPNETDPNKRLVIDKMEVKVAA